ncbi:MAG: hypothetical protein OXI96_08785 [Acidimicrobiaceae bacterium]|nr:hypothetical protein [Acidimicrobiaceae bacterium]
MEVFKDNVIAIEVAAYSAHEDEARASEGTVGQLPDSSDLVESLAWKEV